MPPQNAFQSRAGVSHSARLFVILLIALLVVVAVGFYEFRQIESVFSGPVRFSLIESGTTNWYERSGQKVTTAAGPMGYDADPHGISALAPTLASKETPALAGTAVGILASNGGFTSLFDDGVAKASLTSQPDHAWVVFAETAPASANIMLLQADTAGAKPVFIGKGFSPVFEGTYLVAFDSFGLIRMGIDGTHRVLLAEEPGQAPGTAAIAPDGSAAVAKNANGSIDVFDIVPDSAHAASLGSVNGSADAIAFVTSTEFVVRSGNTFTFYSIAAGKVSLVSTVSL